MFSYGPVRWKRTLPDRAPLQTLRRPVPLAFKAERSLSATAKGMIQMWVASTDMHDQKTFSAELENRVAQRTSELKMPLIILKSQIRNWSGCLCVKPRFTGASAKNTNLSGILNTKMGAVDSESRVYLEKYTLQPANVAAYQRPARILETLAQRHETWRYRSERGTGTGKKWFRSVDSTQESHHHLLQTTCY